MKKYIFLAVAALAMTSCSDFLDKEPLDFASSDSYYKTENDLRMAVNYFYQILPVNASQANNGLYTDDIVSDNMVSTTPQDLLYKGNKRTPDIDNSEWNFSNLRGINFFIQKYYENEKILTGSEIYLKHYLGEAYFFRAYDHFRLLRNYGDAPILTEMLSDDRDELTQHSLRYPRNEVARFILAQLDTAAMLLMDQAPETGRITKKAAYALKSRVALYEGTWEKYHANTCFVPGNSKWVGKDTWPNFTWPAGSADAEINFFLDQAISASDLAVEGTSLSSNYLNLFNQVDVSNQSEVLLARYYLAGTLSHNCSYFLRNGGGRGVTRQAINTFLMQNGLPIYADNSGYHGDTNSFLELMDRDPRLAGQRNAQGYYPRNATWANDNQKFGGFGIVRAGGFIKEGNDTLFYYKPNVQNSGNEKAPTGYELNKWVSNDEAQRVQYGCTTAVPLFRTAECMLNYIEAYYERYGNLGGNCDTYWRAIRSRAGLDTDYQKTIAATVLSQENDLAVWSKGVEVSPTLYNIRRERRCELIAEGRRTDDMKRWRSFDKMVAWQPEGFNFWEEVFNLYTATERQNGISTASISTYLHPFQANENNNAYDGYDFPKPHYLEPIPISEFNLTIVPETGKSILYQNPGWPSNTDGTADYSYDCD